MKIEKINQKFGTIANKLLNHKLLAIAIFVVLLIAAASGIGKMAVETSFDKYFIDGDPMLVKTDEFKSYFGNDYFVGVLTTADNHFTKENLELLRQLTNDLKDSLSYVDKVTSLTDVEFIVGNDEGMAIEQIVPEEIPASRSGLDSIRLKAFSKPHQAKRLVSADGKLSWIQIKLRPFPDDSVWRKATNIAPDVQTGAEVERIITKEKYAQLAPKATGMPYVSHKKLKYIGLEMKRLTTIAFIVSIIIMLLMTRSVKGIIAPFVDIICGLIITFGIAGHTGLYVDSSTSFIIPIILSFAIAVAYNIHLFSYFDKRMLIHGNRRKAVVEAIAETGWPIIFCGLTTIASLLSFLAIPIRPIASIGILTSMCVLFIMICTIIITPMIMNIGRNRAPRPGFTESSDTRWTAMLLRLSHFDLQHPRGIIAVFVAVCVVLGIGTIWVEPAFDLERTMGTRVKYVNDVVNVGKSELGSLYSYDVMIDFDEEGQAKSPEALHNLELLESKVKTYQLTKRTTSILDVVKDMNCTLNGNDSSFYRLTDDADGIAQMLLLYENAGGTESEYWLDYEYKRLRLMVEISDFNSAEVERELNDISQQAASIFGNAKVTAVGNIPQYTTMMQYLVRGQIVSFLISVLIIGIILMIVFQSIRIGLIGLIPNLFPAICIGGYMGWTNIPLDMMTATIIPMIIGLSVDDTIHFINHTKLEFDRNHRYDKSIWQTFRVVGTAIVTTTIIICAVFGGFMVTECNQFINFGLLAIIGIASALIADILITPLLVKRFKVYGEEN